MGRTRTRTEEAGNGEKGHVFAFFSKAMGRSRVAMLDVQV